MSGTRRRCIWIRLPGDRYDADLADDDLSVEDRMLRDERMAAIRSHVMALPERQRMAVLMHKYQGWITSRSARC